MEEIAMVFSVEDLEDFEESPGTYNVDEDFSDLLQYTENLRVIGIRSVGLGTDSFKGSYKSEKEAYEKYCHYAHTHGFSVRKEHHSYWPSTRKVKSKDFVCSKAGFKKAKELNPNSKYRKSCTRTGCPAMRSESTNHVCHGISKPTSSITECFLGLEKMMKTWRRNEKDEDFKCSQSEIQSYIKSSSILKQAAQFYSRKLYSFFEEEFLQGVGGLCIEYSSSDLTTFYVKSIDKCSDSQIWTVQFNSSQGTIQCSCAKFEMMDSLWDVLGNWDGLGILGGLEGVGIWDGVAILGGLEGVGIGNRVGIIGGLDGVGELGLEETSGRLCRVFQQTALRISRPIHHKLFEKSKFCI
ncbi:hypothetical protein M5K25_022304 [Dendrobium thyrsiflorum]|uniref:Protein FAR1-RELATED SEQUENCE n=1 Tax=Dendrobium thyrsiflorum TaxID=117978 RepID=A0ABD0UCB0_DENTH